MATGSVYTPLHNPNFQVGFSMRKNWIAVASAEHARRGRDETVPGFMQVGHGKLAPLRRVRPGDRVSYYAAATTLGGKDKLQSFVSLGLVEAGEPYTVDMGGFVPYRRNVRYLPAIDAPILPLLDEFEFVEDRQYWGYKFRFGLFEISDFDMRLIARAMRADLTLLQL